MLDQTKKPLAAAVSYYRLVDLGGGVSGLEVLQRIWGYCHADVLAYYSAVVTWEDGQLIFHSQSLLPPDAPDQSNAGTAYNHAFNEPEKNEAACLTCLHQHT